MERKIKELSKDVKEFTFTDTYFDNKSFDLTTRDMWLRQRDNIFELKSPSNSVQQRSSDPATVGDEETLGGIDFYDEDRDWGVIGTLMESCANVSVLPALPPTPPAISSTREWLSVNEILPFATIRTQRQRHIVAAYLTDNLTREAVTTVSLNVDIDNVVFINNNNNHNNGNSNQIWQYSIGEVELGTSSCEEGSNNDESDEFGHNNNNSHNPSLIMQQAFLYLGIPTAPVRGKVLEYLYRHSPSHYEALKRSGLIGSKMQ